MRPLPFREVRRKLIAAGFEERRSQGKGSHIKFVKRLRAGVRTAIVPAHGEIAGGTLRSILKQAGISPEEFERL